MVKWIILFFISLLNFSYSTPKDSTVISKTLWTVGTVKLTFKNVVNGLPMVLRDKSYTNTFGENYSISKFKYYVGNITLDSANLSNVDPGKYYLIDQNDTASLSITFDAAEGVYNTINFLLGVDSLHSVSGAQTDALDPVNDMFWTWNNGYVMAKMEGKSTSSAFNNVFEFHIGGFSGKYNVLKKITLQLTPANIIVRQGRTAEIYLEADADAWWQNPNDIHIAATPNITSPGEAAKKISDNYSKMFSVAAVKNN